MLQLKKFPNIPVSTREEARESRPHPVSPVSASYIEGRDPFPAWSGKNSRCSRRISRGGALHRKGERNSRVVPPFPESPRCLSPFQGNLFSLQCLDFQAEDRLTLRWHVGEPCEKASWESHRSLDPRKGKRDTAATAREESGRACPQSRRGLTPLGRLQKYPKIHVSTGEESSGSGTHSTQGLRPCIDGRGIPRGPRATRMGLAFPEANKAGLRGPVVS